VFHLRSRMSYFWKQVSRFGKFLLCFIVGDISDCSLETSVSFVKLISSSLETCVSFLETLVRVSSLETSISFLETLECPICINFLIHVSEDNIAGQSRLFFGMLI